MKKYLKTTVLTICAAFAFILTAKMGQAVRKPAKPDMRF